MAIHIGHVQIQQDCLDRLVGKDFHHLATVLAGDRIVKAGHLEGRIDGQQDGRLVIDDQNRVGAGFNEMLMLRRLCLLWIGCRQQFGERAVTVGSVAGWKKVDAAAMVPDNTVGDSQTKAGSSLFTFAW
jgi:hypothetical protein